MENKPKRIEKMIDRDSLSDDNKQTLRESLAKFPDDTLGYFEEIFSSLSDEDLVFMIGNLKKKLEALGDEEKTKAVIAEEETIIDELIKKEG